MHIFCRCDIVDAIKVFLQTKSFLDIPDKDGKTPLHMVCLWENIDTKLIKCMIDENHFRTDVQDKNGNTPMHIVCRNKEVDAVQVFLQTKTFLDLPNKNGQTPLHIVCSWSYTDNTELISSMINEHRFRDNVKDKDGHNPFELRETLKLYKRKFEDIPIEIRTSGKTSVRLFRQALKAGGVRVFHIRIMIVGHFGVGKTTITKILLQDTADLSGITSTDGIAIYVGLCRINLDNGRWEKINLETNIEEIIGRRVQRLLYDERRQEIMKNPNEEKSLKTKLRAFIPFQNEKLNTNVKGLKKRERERLDKGIQKEIRSTKPSTMHPKQLRYSQNVKKSDTKPETKTPHAPMDSAIDTSGSFKDLTSSMKSLLLLAASEGSSENLAGNFCDVEIWDFGGQSAFYTTHQAFLSPRCIYPLVIDGSKTFDDNVDDEELIPGDKTSTKTKGYFKFWAISIITYSRGKVPGFPKIIPILTHLDRLPQAQRQTRINELFDEMQTICADNMLNDHVIFEPRLSMDATNPDDDAFSLLRTIILDTAKTYPTWGEQMPATWVPMEHTLLKMKAAGIKIIPLQILQHLNKESENLTPLEAEELTSFLDFQHSLGSILYFSSVALRDKIILHPKWLIDALRSLISANRFFTGTKEKEELLDSLAKTGMVERSLITELWNREEYKEFQENADHLLKAMIKMDLLSVPVKYDSEGTLIEENIYLVPSMIKIIPDGELLEYLSPPDTSTVLLYTFEARLLPKAIFNKLVACCLNVWPLEQVKDRSMLYSGFCCFRVDNNHTMSLKMLAYQILLTMTSENKGQSSSLCSGIKHFISEELNRICYTHAQMEGEVEMDRRFYVEIPCCSSHLDCTKALEDGTQICVHHAENEAFTSYEDWINRTETVDHTVDEPCDSSNPCVGKESEPLSDKDLLRLSRKLTCSPVALGVTLGIGDDDIHEIENDYYDKRGERETKLRILMKGNAKSLNIQQLKTHLKEAGENEHIICKVIRRRKVEIQSILKVETMFIRPTEKMLDELALRVDPKEVFQLLLEIGINIKDVDRARVDFSRALEQTKYLLKTWLKNKSTLPKDSPPTFASLEKALVQAGINAHNLLKDVSPSIVIE